jgi:hypothetical protein
MQSRSGFVLLFVLSASAACFGAEAGAGRLAAGAATLDLHVSRTAHLFHVVDQLSEWSEFCHRQYARHFGRLPGGRSAEDRKHLARHAAIRKRRGWGGGLEQAFYTPLELDAALRLGIADGHLTAEEAKAEREVFLHFAPRVEALMKSQQPTLAKFARGLRQRKDALARFTAKLSRFCGGMKVTVPVYLLANPAERDCGGGYNGGRLTLEVPRGRDAYPMFLHELMHAFLETRRAWLERAVRGVDGLDYMGLNEGIAHALAPGILHDGGGDPLAERVRRDLAAGKPLSDNSTRFHRLGLALRPLLRDALEDRTQTLSSFLPRAVDAWRVVAALDGAAAPAARSTAAEAARPARSPRAGKRPPVLAFYYVWYGTPFGPAGQWTHWGKTEPGALAPGGTDPNRVWFEPGLRDVASAAYPLIGPYDSRQREVVRWHVRLAKAAGIDGFLVSWWGPGSWQRPPGQTYKAFVEVLLPVAEEEGFKVCLCDELPQFFKDFDQVVAWAGEYLDRFRRSPAYLHVGGQPVYYVYQVWQGRMSVPQCRRLIQAVEKRVGPVYWIVDKMRCRLAKDSPKNRELYFPAEWLAVREIDALGGYATFSNLRVHEPRDLRILFGRLVDQAHRHGKKVLLPVHPGHNNSKFNRKPYVMPRRAGETFRGFLAAAREADADLIAVTSFNEWPETTVIEPALTWPDPYRYLKIVAGFTGKTWRAPRLPPTKSLDPLIVPLLRRRPAGPPACPRAPSRQQAAETSPR